MNYLIMISTINFLIVFGWSFVILYSFYKKYKGVKNGTNKKVDTKSQDKKLQSKSRI